MEKCDTIYDTALQVFNTSSGLHLDYSMFLETVKGDRGGSKFHLDQASRFQPTLQERFALYLFEHETKHRHTDITRGGSLDLVSYVEFQVYNFLYF